MKKTNNKGFSLVELIIVIAIMAVLIGILAPQFLKYVERSRNSTDVTNAQEIATAIQTYATDATGALTAGDTTVTVGATGAPTITGASVTSVTDALTDAGIRNTTCKSKTAWTGYTVTVTVATDGKVSFTYAGTGEATAGAFAAMMQ